MPYTAPDAGALFDVSHFIKILFEKIIIIEQRIHKNVNIAHYFTKQNYENLWYSR